MQPWHVQVFAVAGFGSTHPVPDACDVLNAQVLGWGVVGIPLMEVVASGRVAPRQVNSHGVSAAGGEDCEQWHVHHEHAVGDCGRAGQPRQVGLEAVQGLLTAAHGSRWQRELQLGNTESCWDLTCGLHHIPWCTFAGTCEQFNTLGVALWPQQPLLVMHARVA